MNESTDFTIWYQERLEPKDMAKIAKIANMLSDLSEDKFTVEDFVNLATECSENFAYNVKTLKEELAKLQPSEKSDS